MLARLLNDYGIDAEKLELFVLDNALNNDTILFKLSKSISFDFLKKRLWYTSHMINIATNTFLHG